MSTITCFLSDYDKGLFFGDGHLIKNSNKFMFSTTSVFLKDYMLDLLNKFKCNFSLNHYKYSGEKSNYEDIYKFSIDINFYNLYLKDVFDNLSSHLSVGFLLGYLVTKGSFFSYKDIHKTAEGSYYDIRYRINLSGLESVLSEIKCYFEDCGIHFTNIIKRRERENQGVISKSYRMYLNRRDDIRCLVTSFLSLNVSLPLNLLNSFKDFIEYDKRTPRFRAKKYYKNYRLACLYLMKELNIYYRGVHGGNESGSGKKPLYLVENNELNKDIYIYGWENLYKKLSLIYENKYGLPKPEVL